MTKKNATISNSADGKTWVMPPDKSKTPKKRAGKKTVTRTPAEMKPSKRTPVLASLEVAPKELVATYKGAPYSATVNPDGTITVNGKTFNSPSRAGKAVTGKEVDGWTFWSYTKEDGSFEKIDALRKRTA